MELTGKCKARFEKWLLKWIKKNVAWESETPTQQDVNHFYSFPDAMKIGVYIDFFDSLKLEIHKTHDRKYDIHSCTRKYECKNGFLLVEYGLSKKAVIKRVNKIFNSNE